MKTEAPLNGPLYGLVYNIERLIKGPLFGCRMCGQCALLYTALVCPMRCPKNMRDGPCGGSTDGMCEVDPTMPCVWCVAYGRSKKLRRTEKLLKIQPNIDWRLLQTSAWINYVTSRDQRKFRGRDGT
ncbi:MAG: methylenetetrahydrofolate reductase C-terminal domain-containing protein [Dehalococcoidia bacterium]